MSLDINSSILKRLQQMQGMKMSKGGSQAQTASAGSGSLMDRLNGLDNQLNNGGGISLDMNSIGGIDNKKKRLM